MIVITYQTDAVPAGGHPSLSLCARHQRARKAVHPTTRAAYHTVSHGAHVGACDVCQGSLPDAVIEAVALMFPGEVRS